MKQMHTRAEPPIGLLEANPAVAPLAGSASLALLQVYFEVNHLKQLFRQGWLRRGIHRERCESVAEHTFGVALLALFLADAYFPGLDRAKLLRIALLHDLGEAYAGDITPAHGVAPDEKRRLEREAVGRILEKLPNGAEYLALWEEYEDQRTPEGRLVRQLDRLEMALQASVYEHQGLADLSEFFDSSEKAISAPELLELFQALRQLRG